MKTIIFVLFVFQLSQCAMRPLMFQAVADQCATTVTNVLNAGKKCYDDRSDIMTLIGDISALTTAAKDFKPNCIDRMADVDKRQLFDAVKTFLRTSFTDNVCVQDVANVVDDGEKVYDDFTKEDVTSIIADGSKMVNDAMAIKTCGSQQEFFKSMKLMTENSENVGFSLQCITDVKNDVEFAEQVVNHLKSMDIPALISDTSQGQSLFESFKA